MGKQGLFLLQHSRKISENRALFTLWKQGCHIFSKHEKIGGLGK